MTYRIPALTLCLCLLASACTNEKHDKSKRKAIPVNIITMLASSSQLNIPYSGTLEATKTVNLGFMVSGKINKVYVDEGAYVQKDQIIADLESTDYQYALDAAKAQYDRASSEYKRLEELYKKNSLTQSDYDKIKASYKEAAADYEYKKKQLNDTKLFAPTEGWISFDQLQKGEIVKQGMPVFQILHTKKIYVKFMVPENEISLIESGKIIEFNIPALGKDVMEASVSQIAPDANNFSRSFVVKAELINDDFNLKPGMMAHVEVPSENALKYILIPARAIRRNADGSTYVYIAQDDRATKRSVKTAEVSGTEIVILEGLTSGEKLIVSGIEKLYEGADISIMEDNQ